MLLVERAERNESARLFRKPGREQAGFRIAMRSQAPINFTALVGVAPDVPHPSAPKDSLPTQRGIFPRHGLRIIGAG